MTAIEKLFSPEFRNRLDAIIPFNSLNHEVMEKIVDKFMAELGDQLAAKNVSLVLDAEARSWLAEKGFDPAFGARPLGRLIQKEIKDVLTDELLFGELAAGGSAQIRLKDDALDFIFTGREKA
jgi:ATP-dependent Clp protease ATP-binding subunit ClpA